MRLDDIFKDITFTTIEGAFDVQDTVIVFRGDKAFVLENPSLIHPLNIRVQGGIGPEQALDLRMRMQFLPRVGDIPVVGIVWDVVNKLTSQILQFRVVGTLGDPQVTLLP
jgi:hypothetical protein